MPRECKICGKKTQVGRSITRRGLAKKKGGIGKKVVRTSLRKFYPNLQTMKANIDGKVRTIRICTRCLKSGKIKKV